MRLLVAQLEKRERQQDVPSSNESGSMDMGLTFPARANRRPGDDPRRDGCEQPQRRYDFPRAGREHERKREYEAERERDREWRPVRIFRASADVTSPSPSAARCASATNTAARS
jgi:hypothetical protein